MPGKSKDRRNNHRTTRKERAVLIFLAGAVLIALELWSAGCAKHKHVVPAPDAVLVPGMKYAAEGKDAGVSVEADGRAWTEHPSDLSRIMTPMEVRIRNESGKPLQIRYKDFTLTTATGFQYQPLPPYQIRGSITHVEPVTPAFGFHSFYISPYYAPYYDWDFNMWPGPFGYDWGYYPTYYAVWSVPLPTRDMLREAIPEGVLAKGGELNGFLYFQRDDRVGSLTFAFNLIDAETQKSFGRITIPFVVEK